MYRKLRRGSIFVHNSSLQVYTHYLSPLFVLSFFQKKKREKKTKLISEKLNSLIDDKLPEIKSKKLLYPFSRENVSLSANREITLKPVLPIISPSVLLSLHEEEEEKETLYSIRRNKRTSTSSFESSLKSLYTPMYTHTHTRTYIRVRVRYPEVRARFSFEKKKKRKKEKRGKRKEKKLARSVRTDQILLSHIVRDRPQFHFNCYHRNRYYR